MRSEKEDGEFEGHDLLSEAVEGNVSGGQITRLRPLWD